MHLTFNNDVTRSLTKRMIQINLDLKYYLKTYRTKYVLSSSTHHLALFHTILFFKYVLYFEQFNSSEKKILLKNKFIFQLFIGLSLKFLRGLPFRDIFRQQLRCSYIRSVFFINNDGIPLNRFKAKFVFVFRNMLRIL